MEHPSIIKRFGPPNAYDQYPYGTICRVQDGSIYRQISRDENNPQWDQVTDDKVDDGIRIDQIDK